MHDQAVVVAMYAAIVAAVVLLRVGFNRLPIPAMVGFLAFGVLLRLGAQQAHFAHSEQAHALHLLGKVGVAILLFRVGLESDLGQLVRQLRCASVIWLGNLTASFAAAYLVAACLLSMPTVPSLVIAVALTATSVGIPSTIWRQTGRLQTPDGERFLDVAELDDISGVMALALLLAILPELRSAGGGAAATTAFTRLGLFVVKLLAFGAACFLYSRYLERHVTSFLRRRVRFADTLIAVVATGLIIAGIAGALGFSMAIGAFFAGLAYSRDPAHSRLDESLSLLYELFVPFFFLSVGFSLFPGSLAGALAPTALLALAAVGGKLAGGAGPALPFTTSVGAVAIGVSMVPRAEICLLVAQRAQAMGPDVLPPEGFTALVLTAAITVSAAPVVLRQVLQRMPEPESDQQADRDASAE